MLQSMSDPTTAALQTGTASAGSPDPATAAADNAAVTPVSLTAILAMLQTESSGLNGANDNPTDNTSPVPSAAPNTTAPAPNTTAPAPNEPNDGANQTDATAPAAIADAPQDVSNGDPPAAPAPDTAPLPTSIKATQPAESPVIPADSATDTAKNDTPVVVAPGPIATPETPKNGTADKAGKKAAPQSGSDKQAVNDDKPAPQDDNSQVIQTSGATVPPPVPIAAALQPMTPPSDNSAVPATAAASDAGTASNAGTTTAAVQPTPAPANASPGQLAAAQQQSAAAKPATAVKDTTADDDAPDDDGDNSNGDTSAPSQPAASDNQPVQMPAAPIAVPVAAAAPPSKPVTPAPAGPAPVGGAAASDKPAATASDKPDPTAAASNQAFKPALHDAANAKIDTAPANTGEPHKSSGLSQLLPNADAAANDASPAPNTPPVMQHQPQPAPQTNTQPAPIPVPVANPAVTQAAPSGLRKLEAGLQIAAQEQETTATADKIGVSIVTKAAEGLRHFDIRLDPPELGRVEVRLTVDESGKAQANLVVDKPQTLELLQRDSTNLNRALSDAGLDLSNNGLNFSLREQNRQNDGGMDQGRSRQLSAKTVVQSDTISIHSPLGSYAPDSVRLDISV